MPKERGRIVAGLSLVRILAVLALVFGIGLSQGTPCEREIAWTPACATSSTHVVHGSAFGGSDDGGAGLLSDLGHAGMFLAVLLAVLIVLSVLRLPGLCAWYVPHVRLMTHRPSRRLEVRLAQLCVLRT